MTEEAIARVEEATSYGEWPESITVAFGFTVSDLRALLSLARQGLEMREALERISRIARQAEIYHFTLGASKTFAEIEAEARAALQSRSR